MMDIDYVIKVRRVRRVRSDGVTVGNVGARMETDGMDGNVGNVGARMETSEQGWKRRSKYGKRTEMRKEVRS
jgi:hypothetical protein